jgi:hypothetical protein
VRTKGGRASGWHRKQRLPVTSDCTKARLADERRDGPGIAERPRLEVRDDEAVDQQRRLARPVTCNPTAPSVSDPAAQDPSDRWKVESSRGLMVALTIARGLGMVGDGLALRPAPRHR